MQLGRKQCNTPRSPEVWAIGGSGLWKVLKSAFIASTAILPENAVFSSVKPEYLKLSDTWSNCEILLCLNICLNDKSHVDQLVKKCVTKKTFPCGNSSSEVTITWIFKRFVNCGSILQCLEIRMLQKAFRVWLQIKKNKERNKKRPERGKYKWYKLKILSRCLPFKHFHNHRHFENKNVYLPPLASLKTCQSFARHGQEVRITNSLLKLIKSTLPAKVKLKISVSVSTPDNVIHTWNENIV